MSTVTGRLSKPIACPKPGRAARLQDEQQQKVSRFSLDDAESKTVRTRSGGRCEVFTEKGRCKRRATAIHHMLGGSGRRGRGESAKAERKQHICDGPGGCHPLITDKLLVLQKAGDLPRFDDVYVRATKAKP